MMPTFSLLLALKIVIATASVTDNDFNSAFDHFLVPMIGLSDDYLVVINRTLRGLSANQ